MFTIIFLERHCNLFLKKTYTKTTEDKNMKKERHNPDKKQNNYGGDYDCENYEQRADKTEWCHDEGQVGWGEWIKWAQTDKDGNLKCKGNRHNCLKMRQKWLASLSENDRSKYL